MEHNYIKRPTGFATLWTTLPIQLNNNLTACDYAPLKLPGDLLSIHQYAFRRRDWQRLTTEIVNAYKKSYNITQRERRRPRIGPQLTAAEKIFTPPGHDYHRSSILQLGSPYARHNPSDIMVSDTITDLVDHYYCWSNSVCNNNNNNNPSEAFVHLFR